MKDMKNELVNKDELEESIEIVNKFIKTIYALDMEGWIEKPYLEQPDSIKKYLSEGDDRSIVISLNQLLSDHEGFYGHWVKIYNFILNAQSHTTSLTNLAPKVQKPEKSELIEKFETLMGTKIPESGDLIFLPFLMGAVKMTHLTEYESVDVMTFLLQHIIASAKGSNEREIHRADTIPGIVVDRSIVERFFDKILMEIYLENPEIRGRINELSQEAILRVVPRLQDFIKDEINKLLTKPTK